MRPFTFSSLRFRLLMLVIVSVIPALGLCLYTASVQISEKEAEIHAEAGDMTRFAANNLAQLAEGASQVLTVLSKLPAVPNYDAAACDAYLPEVKKQLPMYDNIAAATLNGDLFCSAFPMKKRGNIADRSYFQNAFQKKMLSFGEYQVGRITGKPAINAGLPVFDENQQLKAVVLVAIDLNWIAQQFPKLHLPEHASMLVIDRKGTVLYHYPNPEIWQGKDASGYEIVKTILSRGEGITEANGLQGIRKIYSFAPVQGTDKGMYVCAGISPAVVFADVNLTLMKNLLLLILSAFLAGAVAWFGGDYFIMWRIKTLMKATNDLSEGNLGTRVDLSGQGDEIGRLGESFNKMASALQQHIEERRQTEEALRQSEEKYRTLFEESKDTIFMSTPDGRYLDINPAGLEMLGLSSREEALSLDINKDIFAETEDRKKFQKLLHEKGFVKDYQIEMKRKDGRKITVLSTTTVVRNDVGDISAYRGIMRDITEHKRLEQQLVHSQKMEAIGQLAGGIAHDFNNILSAILGYGYLMQTRMGQDDPLKADLEQILESADRAAEVTHSLLAFSRKQVMNSVPLHINDIIRRVEKLLSRIIGEDIEVTTTFSCRNIVVTADAGQIEQVLMNLATNARDAMQHGGKLTFSTGFVELDDTFVHAHGYGKPGTYALITVSDTGTGMKPETLAKIFEPFFTTKDTGKGTGLGLAMVYGIVKQHDGYINVYSEPDNGTAFRIYLPTTKAEGPCPVETACETLPADGTETILVAEDDEKLRKLSEIVLTKHGYQVILAVDGEDAIKKFGENRDIIRLVMLDMIMPRKSGKEVYDEIVKIKPAVRVIFSSGYTADRIDTDSLLSENVYFITKPVSPKDLLKKVREILA
jgi:PAS domain S-box-containing protein